ncbi:MAG: hypothetical protein JO069_06285, partial [Verrucomicrobia bacterium]|nr:hypothetical protein [Verrucomicrobiota bacterium]
LDNPEPDLAVARGAARFGSIVHRRAERIEAGAARAIYLEVQQRPVKEERKPSGPALVCILPPNAPTEEEFRVAEPGLELRVNRPVRFQPYYSTRRTGDRAGALVAWNSRDFQRLPPLQTTARLAGQSGQSDRLPVTLAARMNELGLLQVACVSADPRVPGSWPLEFNLRPHETGSEDDRGRDRADATTLTAATPTSVDPGVAPDRLESAQARMASLFSRPLDPRDKLTANGLLKSLENMLGLPKADWNFVLIRALWPALYECIARRRQSAEHEETWLILAGFLLRPGFGVEGDAGRIDELWRIRTDGLAHPGKRIQLQEYILWRRVAGGLSQERQEAILTPELPRLLARKNPPAELVRLAGALERIRPAIKAALVDRFLQIAHELATTSQYPAPYLVALGLLLNRTPFYAGPESVLSPPFVQRTFETFSDLDWTEPQLAEISALFLRAARVVEDPNLDVPKSLRDKIIGKLQKTGVPPLRLERLRKFVPLASADRAGLFGESLPPGLLIGGA